MPSVQIIRSKLHRPRVPGDFVARGELLTRLEEGSALPLTLLAAPAGYGKTSLIAHWLAGRDGLSAWLSLDAEDSDLVVFVNYYLWSPLRGRCVPMPALTRLTISTSGSHRRWRLLPVA
jgi:ATP/maltotriose-dependent transcriptional regulator MalT